MAQYDYTDLTIANATSGNAILASDHAKVFENVNDLMKPPMCMAQLSGNKSVTSPPYVIPWEGTDIYDSDSMHNPSSNPSRITFQTPGIYLVTFAYYVNYSGTPVREDFYIRGSGTTNIGGRYFAGTITADSFWIGTVSAIVDSATYSYVEAVVGPNNATAAALNVAANTRFSAVWIGKKP